MRNHSAFMDISVCWVGETQIHKHIVKTALKYNWQNLQNIVAARKKDFGVWMGG